MDGWVKWLGAARTEKGWAAQTGEEKQLELKEASYWDLINKNTEEEFGQ